MDWLNSIKEIKKARDNDRLVIFVGAGVSKNSGIPTWSELISEIANEIGYEKEEPLSGSRHDEQQCRDCPRARLYSQEEYLRIPEYFYQLDDSEGHNEYYEFIKKKLNSNDKTSNPINEEIIKILPHHIITTNYDALLENSKTPSVQFYSVISKDADLLSEKKASDQYIIKMHGDFSNIESIVLKESDYINYEQNYPLISTFLRSLLTNHTFLFVGYSLNDNNLNLIIGWINYFKELHSVKESPMNFWLSDKPASSFEISRLMSKDIAVIDLNTLPETLVSSAPAEITSLSGKKVYAYLHLISDDDSLNEYIDFSDLLSEKLGMLKPYKYVSREDIKALVRCGPIKLSGYSIVFYDEDKYDLFAKSIIEGAAIIKETLEKAKVDLVFLSSKMESKNVHISESVLDEIERMYLNNDYINLAEAIIHCDDIATKIYYGTLLNKTKEIDALVQEEACLLYDSDLITVLLHKTRVRLATMNLLNPQMELAKEFNYLLNLIPYKYKNAVRFLDVITHSEHKNLHIMNELLQKQERRNEYRQNGWTTGHAFELILELQAYAYDYYHYFKINRLPLDGFSNPKTYFSYYVKAMLCSYSPIPPDSEKNLFGIRTHREKYPLNEIDLDIVVKYVTHKNLSAWTKQYCVTEILFDESINSVAKYENLCRSLCILKVPVFTEYLHTFSLLIKLSDKDGGVSCAALQAIVSVFIELSHDHKSLCGEMLKSIRVFTEVKAAHLPDVCNSLITGMCSEDMYQYLREHYRSEMEAIFDSLGGMCSDETKEYVLNFIKQTEDIDECINRIFTLRKIVSLKQSKSYLESHIDKLSEENIFFCLLDDALDFNKNLEDRIVNKIKACYEERRKSPGVRVYPDPLKATIDIAIIIRLFGFDFDISRLEPYSEQSEYIRFILNPDIYDYSKVDMTDFMWVNLIWSKEYGNHFIAHKNELLSESLKDVFDKGKETKSQQKIVYGLLLSKDELQKF
ncbi:MAG: SIR2 family protein [Christensenellales bacterium]|jgi:NAD-dependent SIR2 family protein deacetylase